LTPNRESKESIWSQNELVRYSLHIIIVNILSTHCQRIVNTLSTHCQHIINTLSTLYQYGFQINSLWQVMADVAQKF